MALSKKMKIIVSVGLVLISTSAIVTGVGFATNWFENSKTDDKEDILPMTIDDFKNEMDLLLDKVANDYDNEAFITNKDKLINKIIEEDRLKSNSEALVLTEERMKTAGWFNKHTIGLNDWHNDFQSVKIINSDFFHPRNNPKISSVFVPEQINYIGKNAFFGIDTMVEIEETKNSDRWLFLDDSSLLSTLTLPESNLFEGIVGIAHDALKFSDVSINSLTLPKSLKYIDDEGIANAKYVNDKPLNKPILNFQNREDPIYLGNSIFIDSKVMAGYDFYIPKGNMSHYLRDSKDKNSIAPWSSASGVYNSLIINKDNTKTSDNYGTFKNQNEYNLFVRSLYNSFDNGQTISKITNKIVLPKYMENLGLFKETEIQDIIVEYHE